MLSNASVPHECFINSHWLFCSVGHGVANRPLVPLNAFIWFELSIVSSSTNTHINMASPLPAVNLILIKTLVTSDSMKAQRIDWRNSFNTSLRSSTVASISTSACVESVAYKKLNSRAIDANAGFSYSLVLLNRRDGKYGTSCYPSKGTLPKRDLFFFLWEDNGWHPDKCPCDQIHLSQLINAPVTRFEAQLIEETESF